MNSDLLIRRDFSLHDYNTFGVNAVADAFLPVASITTLRQLRNTPTLASLERLVLGGGSNILLLHDFAGLVLHMQLKGIAVTGDDADFIYVTAAAGENWHGFVQWSLAHGLAGLENLSLIPGSVGAAPIQNIGAYGVELADFLHAVSVFDFDSGEVSVLSRDQCEFAYRSSIFKHRLRDKAVILDVTFALPKRWQPNISYAEVAQEIAAREWRHPSAQQISEAVIAIRRRKLPDPAVTGNAGSFFKNPLVSAEQRDALLIAHPKLISHPQHNGMVKLAAGWLIDQCGWKGKHLGHAGVYEKQALVLVNRGGASGNDIAALASAIQADVQQRFGVLLEPEPVFIG